MEFVDRKYYGILKFFAYSVDKLMFLKLKLDTPLSSNFSKKFFKKDKK